MKDGVETDARQLAKEKEQHAALRAEDEKISDEIHGLRFRGSHKLQVCMGENNDLFKKSFALLEKKVSHEEIRSCAANEAEKQSIDDCVDEIFLRRGSVRELIEYYLPMVEAEKKVVACVKDDKRWDPAIDDEDFNGSLNVQHPDPDIRERIQKYSNLSEKGRKIFEYIRTKKGSEKAWNMLRNCDAQPAISQCSQQQEELLQLFRTKGKKQNYLDYLEQMITCQVLDNECMEAKRPAKSSK